LEEQIVLTISQFRPELAVVTSSQFFCPDELGIFFSLVRQLKLTAMNPLNSEVNQPIEFILSILIIPV